MNLSQALRNLILIQTTMMLVHGEKGSMDSSPTAVDDYRALKENGSSKDDRYPYLRNYVAVIEPENFVTLTGSGGEQSPLSLQGSSIVEFGNVYDPADLAIVNKLNGVEMGDPFFDSLFPGLRGGIIGQRYAGDRQPKFPVPPGDKSYFFHGECVATSSSSANNNFGDDTFIFDLLTQTSHTCNLNICLGGGGFDCIAIYAGTAFVFNIGQQVSKGSGDSGLEFTPPTEVKLPPPFPATIIGGTGSFEGIEGTVDIATICGSTGPFVMGTPVPTVTQVEAIPQVAPVPQGTFIPPPMLRVKIGYIVQTIRIKSNMPLPVAP